MKILLVNDDGIDAPGIMALVKRLSGEHEILISAPDGQRSGYSHSITFMQPVTAEKRTIKGYEDIRAYAVGGSPADCVKLALVSFFKDEKIDMVISGINNGSNLGRDICYSGTCGAAMEAAVGGVRAIAVSCYTEIDNPAFEFTADFIAEYISSADISDIPIDTVININVPDTIDGKVKGIELTSQYGRYYNETYDIIEKDGKMICQLTYENKLPTEEGTDVYAIANGYISITPLKFGSTDNASLEILKSLKK